MKDRYFYSDILIDEDKKFRKLKSTLYPKIEQQDDDIIITTVFGDRLDLLAFRYYGDVTLWWIIAQSNNIGKGTLNITPGIKLRIPQNIDKIFSDLEDINKQR